MFFGMIQYICKKYSGYEKAEKRKRTIRKQRHLCFTQYRGIA